MRQGLRISQMRVVTLPYLFTTCGTHTNKLALAEDLLTSNNESGITRILFSISESYIACSEHAYGEKYIVLDFEHAYGRKCMYCIRLFTTTSVGISLYRSD